MKGKILTNASAIDRSKTDFYATPHEVTHALMNYIKIKSDWIHECACGKGDMSEVLKQYVDHVTSTDKYDSSYGVLKDFLTIDNVNADWIITNPPFKQAEAFIRQAYELNKPFAFLLKSQYWHAKSRTALFKECKPSHVLALNWRPDFLHGLKGGSPTMECLWVVWDRKSVITVYDILEKYESKTEV